MTSHLCSDQDSSTPREPPSASPQCDQCEERIHNIQSCNVCESSYCETCWMKAAPHRNGKLGPGGIPHEKTDPNIATKIRSILEPDANQRQAHEDDEATTWFGVATDESDDYIFQDYGRYSTLMADVADWNRRRSDPKIRFPSLVSFVGQTGMIYLTHNLLFDAYSLAEGAGKSTLIKALIKVKFRTWLAISDRLLTISRSSETMMKRQKPILPLL